MKEHIESIDILKGITIILVIVGHALQGILSTSNLTINMEYNTIFVLRQIIYGFHMPLFFIISGLFIDFWSKKNIKEAILQKIFRLVVPYFIWSAITAIIMQLAINYTNNGLGIKEFLLSPIIPFSQYWFLYVLFFLHIIYYVCLNIIKENGKLLFLLISFILYVLNPLFNDIWILKMLCRYMVFFSIGSYILTFIDLKQFSCEKILLPTVIFLFFNIMYIKIIYIDNVLIKYYFWFITSIIGSYYCFIISYYIINKMRKIKVVLGIFGRYSMEIYCTHLFGIVAIRIFLLKFLGIKELWFIVITSVVFTLLVYFIIFKNFSYKKTKIKLLFGTK